MGRRVSSFRQTDLARALKAARSAGIGVARIEIDKDGKLVLVMNSGTTVEPATDEVENWLGKHAR